MHNVHTRVPKMFPKLTLDAHTPNIVPLPFFGNQLVMMATQRGHPTLWNIPLKKKIRRKNQRPDIPAAHPNPRSR